MPITWLNNIPITIIDLARCAAALIILIGAIFKSFLTKKLDDDSKKRSHWGLVLISIIGILMDTSLAYYFTGFSSSDMELFKLLPAIGFLVAAIGALSGKRIWCLLGAVYFSLVAILRMTTRLDYVSLTAALSCILLSITVIWQYRAHKPIPMVIWIILIVLCIWFGNYWINLTLIAMVSWLSPKAEKKDKTPKDRNMSAQIQDTSANVEEKLKALETLQELCESGVITQEEFDAKKKQLLGL